MGGSAGRPDYFEVVRKDGSVSRYGDTNTHDSEHTLTDPSTTDPLPDRVLTWALSRFEDSAGNGIEYTYTATGDGHRISEIRYAYGSGTVAQAAVRFTYDDRDDGTAGYLAGYPLQSSQRLSSITVHAQRVHLRTYKLHYDAAPYDPATDELSRLTGVEECAGASTVCLPATAFDWSLPAAGFDSVAAATLTLNTEGSWTPVDFNPADINGDGRTDLVWTETKGSKHRLQYALANPSTGALAMTAFTTGAMRLEYEDNYGDHPREDNLRVHTEVVDYNGDGRHDILVYSTEDNETRVHLAVPQSNGGWRLSAGTGTDDLLFTDRYRYADLNSDGLLDAYKLVARPPAQPGLWAPAGYDLEVRYLTQDTTQAATSSRYYAFGPATTEPLDFAPQAPGTTGTDLTNWHSLVTAKVQVADVDGDGRADLVTWGKDSTRRFDQGGGYTTSNLRRLEVFRQTDTGFDRYDAALNVTPLTGGNVPKGLLAADLNQDGLSDLVYFLGRWYEKSSNNWQWTGDWYYRLSTGAGFTDATVLLAADSAGAQAPASPSLHDENGDGYADFLWHDVPNSELEVRHWSPEHGAFETGTPKLLRATDGEDEEQYFTLDVNGDGNGDLLHVSESSGSTETLKTYLQPTSGRANLITAVTNGLGAETDISYEPLSTTDAYARIDGLHTATTEENRCFTWGSFSFCWPVQTAHLSAADFYADLNDPWPDLTDPVTGTMGPPVLELMGPLYVVTRVDSSAPTGSDASAKSGICYLYEQGKVQAAGRGLLGFKTLGTMDLQTGVTTTTSYRQDFPYIGLPVQTEVRTVDNLLLRASANTWRLAGYETDDTATPNEDESWKAIAMQSGSAALGPLQPYIEESVERVYDLPAVDDMGTAATDDDMPVAGALLTTVTTDNDYDGWGNPTVITTTTEDHANNKRFWQETVNSYGANPAPVGGNPTWEQEFGRLTRAVVTRERNETANDDNYDTNLTASRTSAFSYYTSGIEKGLLHTETREPDDTQLKHQTTYHYDTWGNRVRAETAAAADGLEEYRCIQNDTLAYDAFGRYAVTEKDCLGHLLRTLTYNAHGLPATVVRELDFIGAGKLTTTHHYTPGGRLYFSRDTTGAYTGMLRVDCDGMAGCPAGAVFYTETRQAGGGVAREYADVLGRVVRSQVKGFAPDTWINTDTEYDFLGRVAQRSEPYYADAIKVYWTTFGYDLLGRVVQTVLPDDTALLDSEVTVTHAGRETTTTNALGQTLTEARNALDEVIETADHAGTTVTHRYDAWGQVTQTTTAGTGVSDVVVTMEYDDRGRRTRMTDPDRGMMMYAWNGFDEVVKQTDAVGNVQEMEYDGLGRLKTRRDYEPGPTTAAMDDEMTGNTSWNYDRSFNGLGQLNYVEDTVSDYKRTVFYDSLGRADVTEMQLGASGADGTYYAKQTYDAYGRPHQHFDASRTSRTWDDNVTEIRYNPQGYAFKWADGVHVNSRPRSTYREITAQDARGNVTGEKLGGGAIRTDRTFDAGTGRIADTTSATLLGSERLALGYTWDVLGNLTTRTDTTGTRNLTETFEYDNLNRLTSSQVGTGTAQTVSYDAHGNITCKRDVDGTDCTRAGARNYTYGTGTGTEMSAVPGPHAVTQAGSDTYTYDANGNQLTGAGRTLTYNAFNKVASVTKGNHTVTFAYGPERARYKRTDTDNQGTTANTADDETTTTLYVGNVEKVIAPDGTYQYRRTLAGGVALVTEDYSASDSRTGTVVTKYLLRDHLGSVSTLVDALGAMVQAMSYDPWGQRRNAADWQVLSSLSLTGFDTSMTRRGFTGHEMVDTVGIIHMNGRIYDARLGRFMQADPVIQFPDYSQSWNRYSYVLNNPLNATDPTGYILGTIGGIIGGAIGFITCGTPCAKIGAAIGAGLGASAEVLIRGGNLGQALLAGVSAAAFTYAGGRLFPGVDAAFGKVLLYGVQMGVIGGITTTLQGGKFGHGFVAAGTAAFVGGALARSGWFHRLGKFGRFVTSSVAGGTVSRITGGKFANGALTAAFAYTLSSAARAAAQRSILEGISPAEFEKRIGMTVRESMSEFEDETNGPFPLTKQDTLRLFTDDVFAQKQLIAHENLDTVYRNILNTYAATSIAAASTRGYVRQPWYKNLFHNPLRYTKWVGPNGHFEVVFDSYNKPVTDLPYKGTFNFFSPADGSGHWKADVGPYLNKRWGN